MKNGRGLQTITIVVEVGAGDNDNNDDPCSGEVVENNHEDI